MTRFAVTILLISILALVWSLPAAAAITNGQIVFASDRDLDYEIFSVDAAGGPAAQLTENWEAVEGDPDTAMDGSPVWSGDGKSILYVTTYFGPGIDNMRELAIMDYETRDRVIITHNDSYEYDPDWSADGSKIVFSAADENGDDGEIFLFNTVTGNTVKLTENSVEDSQPTISADGTKIAFTRMSSPPGMGGQSDIYKIESDWPGTKLTKTNVAYESSPDFSWDGTKIVYQSSTGGIHKMAADGSGATQITDDESDGSPSWSPDGKRVTFSSKRTTGIDRDIYVMDADGSGILKLTDNPATDTSPTWQPLHQPDPPVTPDDGPGLKQDPQSGPWPEPLLPQKTRTQAEPKMSLRIVKPKGVRKGGLSRIRARAMRSSLIGGIRGTTSGMRVLRSALVIKRGRRCYRFTEPRKRASCKSLPGRPALRLVNDEGRFRYRPAKLKPAARALKRLMRGSRKARLQLIFKGRSASGKTRLFRFNIKLIS